MMEGTQEIVKNPDRRKGIVDVRSPNYFYHNAPLEKVGSILTQGILSPKLASRTSSADYTRRTGQGDERNVSLSQDLKSHNFSPFVGFVVSPEKLRVFKRRGALPDERVARFRVAPRYIVGLIARGDNNEEMIQQVEKLKEILTGLNSDLPVYDSQGNLLLPKKMTHEEIVEELRRKNEVQQV